MPNTIDHPALTAMLGESIEHKMPECFRGDLIIDVSTLMDLDHSIPFIWLLRQNGTHIFFDADPKIASLFDHEPRRFYIWVEGHLRSTTPDCALAMLRRKLREMREVAS